MVQTRRKPAKAFTEDQWMKLAVVCRQQSAPSSHPRERRTRKRVRMPALAAVTFRPGGRFEDETTYWNCPVVDVSDGGLAIRSYRKIAAGTRVAIDINVLDKRFSLTGNVSHSTGFPGNVQVGIILDFDTPPDEAEHTDD